MKQVWGVGVLFVAIHVASCLMGRLSEGEAAGLATCTWMILCTAPFLFSCSWLVSFTVHFSLSLSLSLCITLWPLHHHGDTSSTETLYQISLPPHKTVFPAPRPTNGKPSPSSVPYVFVCACVCVCVCEKDHITLCRSFSNISNHMARSTFPPYIP